MLILATALWGSTFVLVHEGQKSLRPSVLIFWRFLIASIALSPFLRFNKKLWLAAAELSVWLFLGYATQAIGLLTTNVNHSAFITAMNVIFVPILAALAGRRTRWLVWASALTALLGCAVLSLTGTGGSLRGDLWTLLCAITCAIYLIRMERHVGRFSALQLTAAQLPLVTIWCAVWMCSSTPPAHEQIPWGTIIYLGLACTMAPTLLQTLGQRRVPAAQAAILFTMEPVFAAIFAFILLRETLTPRGYVGAGLILLAAIACQIEPGDKKQRAMQGLHRGPFSSAAHLSSTRH